MTGRRFDGVLWLVVLIAAAAATATGALVLYVVSAILPSRYSGHKGGAGPSPLLHDVPFDLMLAGMVGVVVGVGGIWRSRRQLIRAPGLRLFALNLVTAFLAALGAWPTPGLLRDSDLTPRGRIDQLNA